MNRLRRIAGHWFCAVFLFLSVCAHADDPGLLKAFPEAEGYGAGTPGGRGGVVLFVTTLDDYLPGKEARIEGSLRAAVDTEGPRMILFRIGGTIRLKADLWIQKPLVTIAGQSAPGGGICIRDYQVVVATHDVILRHLRIRSGGVTQKEQMAVGIFGGTHSIIDHCSMSWATDEVMSSFGASNITVQWSIIAEGLSRSFHPKGEHSKGSILSGDGGITIHHCIYAHNSARNPRVHGAQLDFRNNLIYNWGYRCGYTREAPCFVNYVNNYFKPGPSTREKQRAVLFEAGDDTLRMMWSGNVLEGFPEHTLDNRNMLRPPKNMPTEEAMTKIMAPRVFDCPPVATDAAEKAMARILAGCGAVWPRRDLLDERLMREIERGEGRIIDSEADLGGWPALDAGRPLADTQNAGMPDEWQEGYRLGSVPGADHDGDAYTDLEEFLNRTDPTVPESGCRMDETQFRAWQTDASARCAQGAREYEALLAEKKQKREIRKQEIIASLQLALMPGLEAKPGALTLKHGDETLLELVRIPAGSFMMGSPESEMGQEKERPQHKVNISKSFYMAATPCTAGQFRAVMGAETRPGDKTPEDVPVKEATWFEAVEFCEILSAVTGKTFRLPTEAEWEYACRAGTTTAFYTGDTITTAQANFNGLESTPYNPGGTFLGKETPVKVYPPNPWGLYDMPGNQAEYCQDYAFRVYTAQEVTDPIGTEDSSGRVLRGGKAGSKAWYIRSAARYSYTPGVGYGFRVVMEVDE